MIIDLLPPPPKPTPYPNISFYYVAFLVWETFSGFEGSISSFVILLANIILAFVSFKIFRRVYALNSKAPRRRCGPPSIKPFKAYNKKPSEGSTSSGFAKLNTGHELVNLKRKLLFA